jgi:hypothetical protein
MNGHEFARPERVETSRRPSLARISTNKKIRISQSFVHISVPVCRNLGGGR